MKQSTDMFSAKDSRVQDIQAIVLKNNTKVKGTAYSPFVISLREEQPTSPPMISSPIHHFKASSSSSSSSPSSESIGYEHLFARSAQVSDEERIPKRSTQIQNAKQSMEGLLKFQK